MFAVMREGALVEGFIHHIDLLFEEFAVGVLVDDGVTEDLDFPGVVAPADAEADTSVGEDVGGCVVFSKAKGCHIGLMLKPQPKRRSLVRWARCTKSIKRLGMHS